MLNFKILRHRNSTKDEKWPQLAMLFVLQLYSKDWQAVKTALGAAHARGVVKKSGMFVFFLVIC